MLYHNISSLFIYKYIIYLFLSLVNYFSSNFAKTDFVAEIAFCLTASADASITGVPFSLASSTN